MSHTLTATTPTTPAAVAANLATPVPDGGDFRTIESLYGAFQSLLNVASIAAQFVTGGTIGDGTGATVVLANALSTTGAKDISSGQDVNATRDVNAANNVNATGSVHATVNVSGQNLIIAGQCALSGAILFSGAGRLNERVHAQVGAPGMVANVATASRYFYPTAAASSVVQVDDAGAQDGDYFIFSTFESTNTILVKDPSGSTLAQLQYTVHPQWQRITRVAGVWKTTEIGGV